MSYGMLYSFCFKKLIVYCVLIKVNTRPVFMTEYFGPLKVSSYCVFGRSQSSVVKAPFRHFHGFKNVYVTTFSVKPWFS